MLLPQVDGPLPKLSASRSKSEFFRHLGLIETDEDCRQLYREMMSEAATGRQRTCENRENLTPQSRADASLTPPYSSAMIMESALHKEVEVIFMNASPRTAPWYRLGVYRDGSNTENWVIRWCLWHVFRYRDDRNRNRGNASSATARDRDSDEDENRRRSGRSGTHSPTAYYDPVRDL